MTITSDQVLALVKEILSESPGKEQHINDIAEKAVRLNKNFGETKEKLAEKLSAVLSSNSKSKKAIVLRIKNKKGGVRRGFYKLKRSAVGPRINVSKVKAPTVPTIYSGAAGEYAVASQLLFWGFNVSKPFVDNGIDLTAEKDGKTQFIQVKTCSAKDGENAFKFKIDEAVFAAASSKNPYYVFVMRSGNTMHYAILPNAQLAIWRKNGLIQGKDFSVVIERDTQQKQYRLAGQDINPYIDDFKIIN